MRGLAVVDGASYAGSWGGEWFGEIAGEEIYKVTQ